MKRVLLSCIVVLWTILGCSMPQGTGGTTQSDPTVGSARDIADSSNNLVMLGVDPRLSISGTVQIKMLNQQTTNGIYNGYDLQAKNNSTGTISDIGYGKFSGQSSVIVNWNTQGVPDGTYTVTYYFSFLYWVTIGSIQVVVNNTAPVANPTPAYYADVNGDHYTDRVTVMNGAVSVALGNADGSFGPVSYTSGAMLPNNLLGLTLVDVNGDGRSDLVVWSNNNSGDWGPGWVVVGLSQGTGTSFTGFQQWSTASGKVLPSNLLGVALADVNGDGRADLVAWSRNSNGDWGPGWVVVGLSLGSGTTFGGFQQWTSSSGTILPSNLATVSLTDMTADGRADLVVRSNSSSGDWQPRTVAIGAALGSGTSFNGFQQWTSSHQE